MQTKEREFLTEIELEAIGIASRRTLQKHRLLGKGLPYVRVEGSIRYRRRDIEEYLSRRTVNPAAGQPSVLA